MMPSLNLFRQASAEADVRSEMSNIGIALLVLGRLSAAGLWQRHGTYSLGRGGDRLRRHVLRLRAEGAATVAEGHRAPARPLPGAHGARPLPRHPGDRLGEPVRRSAVRVTDVRAETALTRDTVPVNVAAIVFWVVWNAEKSILEVMNFGEAVKLSAQTALRESIGRHELAQMITDREALGKELQRILDQKTNPRGITVQSVEIRDVQLPKELEDAMSRRAQAERERQARIILGTAETEISEKFAAASVVYQNNPVALHLRAMNMLYEAIKERGSMIIVPSSAVETMGLGSMMGAASLAGARVPVGGPAPIEGTK